MTGIFHDINLFWLYNSLYVVYVVTVIAIIGVVVSENRNPVKSLAWVTVLMLLPMLGIVLYIVFGRSIKNTRMISRRNRRKLRRREDAGRKIKISKLPVDDLSKQLLQLGRTVDNAGCYTGNDVKIYTEGKYKFDDLIADLEGATTSINMEYYIFAGDELGRRIADILIDKAKSGVTVRLIYDHVGSYNVRNSFFREMKKAGVQVYPFFRVVFPFLGTRVNWRNHRKICIIDGRVGYIGGMNIADRYIHGTKRVPVWRDTHVRVTGPVVGGLLYSFAVDWNFMGQPLIADDVSQRVDGDVTMQVLTSGPTSTWSNISMLFIKAISSASKKVYLQTPYFLPDEASLRALQAASLSGVDVRVMIPEHSDSWMLTQASSSYIGECLQAGIKMYFYKAGMLHAKVLIVDDELVSVGSTNFDFRSFEHNFEGNIQMFSKHVNKQMTDIFLEDLSDCERINQSTWRKRPFISKLAQSATRLLSPIL